MSSEHRTHPPFSSIQTWQPVTPSIHSTQILTSQSHLPKRGTRLDPHPILDSDRSAWEPFHGHFSHVVMPRANPDVENEEGRVVRVGPMLFHSTHQEAWLDPHISSQHDRPPAKLMRSPHHHTLLCHQTRVLASACQGQDKT